jgi:hypothetical protein
MKPQRTSTDSVQIRVAIILGMYGGATYFAHRHRHTYGLWPDGVWAIMACSALVLGVVLRTMNARRKPIKPENYKLAG